MIHRGGKAVLQENGSEDMPMNATEPIGRDSIIEYLKELLPDPIREGGILHSRTTGSLGPAGFPHRIR